MSKLVVHGAKTLVIETATPTELMTVDEMARRYVRVVLEAVKNNKTHAARVLGIDRRSLYRRLEGKPEPEPEPEPEPDALGRPATEGDGEG